MLLEIVRFGARAEAFGMVTVHVVQRNWSTSVGCRYAVQVQQQRYPWLGPTSALLERSCETVEQGSTIVRCSGSQLPSPRSTRQGGSIRRPTGDIGWGRPPAVGSHRVHARHRCSGWWPRGRWDAWSGRESWETPVGVRWVLWIRLERLLCP